jgi:hypothetical protein
MKNLLFVLFLMFVTGAAVSAQTVGPTENKPRAAEAADCGCEDKPLPDVLGVVNGVKITKQDLSPETRARVEQLQRTVIEARQRELDLQIDSILLESEAKKRGVTPSQVIKDEVIAKVQAPTEAEAQGFYEQNNQRQEEQARKFAERLRSTAQLKILAKPSAPSSSNADRARVLAIVNNKQITMGDIENSLRPLIFNVQKQVYAARKQDLELKINDTLLAQEAKKRGLTTQALLDAEVTAKVARVTDAQAQAFYEENKERISGEFAQTKAQIIQYMQERKDQETTLAFAEQLRRTSAIQINLTAPESPTFSIATDDQPAKRKPNVTKAQN